MILLTNRIKPTILYYNVLKWVMLLLVALHSVNAHSQAFTLSVTATHETCGGNGSLTFNVQGAVPNVPVVYRVYLMPNAVNPINLTNATVVQGLDAGEYLISATQTVNGQPSIATAVAQINNETVPITIDVNSINSQCGNDGSITVTVTGGVANQFEITSGPVTRPLQSGNVFYNLPSGVYQVRAVNSCGDAAVAVHTMFTDGPVMEITELAVPEPMLPACNKIKIEHKIRKMNDVPLPYPFHVKMTLYPPDGSAPVVYTQVITTGEAEYAAFQQIIPFYYDVDYYYDLEITYSCGVLIEEDVLVRQKLITGGGFEDAGCAKQYLIVGVRNYMPPYTLTFTEYPPGFNPNALNPMYPGPFTEANSAYGGEGIPVPFGTYKYTVNDACGRTADGQTILTPPFAEPTILINNSGCSGNLGGVEIFIGLLILDTAFIIDAPDDYEHVQDLPYDVSEYINDDDKLKMEDLPTGTYIFKLIDKCGGIWEREVIINEAALSVLSYNNRPDCTIGKTTIKVFTQNPPFTSIKITAAPAGFPHPLPYDATPVISSEDGSLYMDNLPPGTYSFKGGDSCMDNLTLTIPTIAYEAGTTETELIPHCGSFDLFFKHQTTSPIFLSYWLQKEISPGVWGHPNTGTLYTEGAIPVSNDSYRIYSNTINYNIESIGHFRIVKYFRAFGNNIIGSDKECIEILKEFDFTGELDILEVKNLSCPGSAPSIKVVTNGVEPIIYRITHKNSIPYTADNGTSSIFNGLDQAVYTFQAEDSCGRQSSKSFNIANVPPIVTANTAPDMMLCDNGNDGTEVFNLSQQNNIILGLQNTNEYTITYHATLQDAEQGLAPLSANYNSGSKTIFGRVVFSNGTITCQDITSFQLVINGNPIVTMPDTYMFCEDSTINIAAPEGFVNYKWINGNSTQSTRIINVGEAGLYTLTVTDGNGCTATKTITAIVSPSPAISNVTISDWSDSNNSITVIAQPSGSESMFEYSLDGINYQESNVFEHLPSGPYTVYVRDVNRCGLDNEDVFLLTYPRFFTPNGDGENERWRIKFSQMEPDMQVYIFDRYGKLLSSFGANHTGWDGTYNGKQLPATDYWFVVKRQDGREMRGHFSMLR